MMIRIEKSGAKIGKFCRFSKRLGRQGLFYQDYPQAYPGFFPNNKNGNTTIPEEICLHPCIRNLPSINAG